MRCDSITRASFRSACAISCGQRARLLRLSPYISTARDAAALHAYVAWKALAYRGKKHKRGQAPGLSYQSVANELSSIRTFHAEALGVHLHKIDPLAKQLVKGIRRISGSVQSPLRFTQQMMLEMEVLDEQPANMGQLAWAHACARRWCFDAMLRISEIAATPTTQHFLLHKDVLFDFDEIGRPSRITWVLRSAKNSQYTRSRNPEMRPLKRQGNPQPCRAPEKQPIILLTE